MAKFKIIDIETSVQQVIGDNYLDAEFALVDDRESFAQFDDAVGGFQIVFLGDNFEYQDGSLVSGTVREAQFRTTDGEAFVTVKDAQVAAANAEKAIFSEGSVATLLDKLLKFDDRLVGTKDTDVLDGGRGDDILKGKGSGDELTGEAGDDILIGGGGGDFFDFFGEKGRDVITDFTIGDGLDSDTVFIRNTEFTMTKSQGDLLLVFNDDSSVLLDGVAFADRGDVQINTGF
jgi:Ca2+-binding RTX toxin-like protein